MIRNDIKRLPPLDINRAAVLLFVFKIMRFVAKVLHLVTNCCIILATNSYSAREMMSVVVEFFTHICDYCFIIQLIAVSAATVLLLGVEYKKIKLIRFFVDVLWLSVTLLALHLVFYIFGKTVVRIFTTDFPYMVGITIYTVARSRHRKINRLAMAIVLFSLCTLMAALGTILGNAIEHNVAGFDIAVTKILSYVMIVVCALLFFRYPLFKFETTLYDCMLNVSCNILSALLFIIYDYMRQSSVEMMRSHFLFAGFVSVVIIFLLLINIATYFMTYGLVKERERVFEYNVQAQKSQSLKELLALNEYKLAELREVRHDVKNQYAYMQMLLESNKYNELKSYFDEVLGTLAKPLYQSVNSGNALIDSVLNLELAKADERGVKINIRVAVPDILPFSKSSVLGLFTNVIDNAVEAVLRDGKAKDGIDVVVGMQGDYMLFCVTNPTTATDADTTVKTSKSDKALHGYGMKIIKKIVKKYNGYFRCFIKDGQFVSESLLDTRNNGATE